DAGATLDPSAVVATRRPFPSARVIVLASAVAIAIGLAIGARTLRGAPEAPVVRLAAAPAVSVDVTVPPVAAQTIAIAPTSPPEAPVSSIAVKIPPTRQRLGAAGSAGRVMGSGGTRFPQEVETPSPNVPTPKTSAGPPAPGPTAAVLRDRE